MDVVRQLVATGAEVDEAWLSASERDTSWADALRPAPEMRKALGVP